jgi:protein-disulfide isomerase
MDKRFLGILIALVIIFIGIFSISQKSTNNSNGKSSGGSAQGSNHVKGQNQKNITLVEYGDYECPVCEAYEPTVEQVYAKYGNDIHFQFRNLPLVSIHKNAFAGARAAEAAALQGKFWEMHDKLYESTNWQLWTVASDPTSDFVSFAKDLGLDTNKFKQDYSGEKVNDTINADLTAFGKTGQSEATPTFFLNGRYVDNAQLADVTGPSLDKFSTVLDAAIAKQSAQQNK